MARQSREYFIAKFIPGYYVTAQDMDDLAESYLNTGQDFGQDANGFGMMINFGQGMVVDYSNKNIINMPNLTYCSPTALLCNNNAITELYLKFLDDNITEVDCSNNVITFIHIYQAFENVSNFNAQNNALTAAAIEALLVILAANGRAVTVDVSLGTNAAHSTWTAPALAAEVTIIANGGTVTSNP